VFRINRESIGDYASEIEYPYLTTNVYFALAKEIDNKVTNISAFLGCRDLLIGSIRRKAYSEAPAANKTELLFYKQYKSYEQGNIFDRLVDAVTLLNVIERRNRWKHTQVYAATAVEDRNATGRQKGIYDKKFMAYVSGSRCWRNNIYFMYMYIHIIRAFANDFDRKLHGVTKWKDFIHTARWMSYTSGMDRWPLIWQNRRRLFKGVLQKEMYKNIWDTDGIFRLTEESCAINRINSRYKKLIKEKVYK